MFAKRDGHFKHIPRFCANCVSLKPSNGSKGDGRLQSGASALWTLEVLYMIPIIEIKEELFVEKIMYFLFEHRKGSNYYIVMNLYSFECFRLAKKKSFKDD